MQAFDFGLQWFKPVLFLLGIALIPCAVLFLGLRVAHSRNYFAAYLVVGLTAIVIVGVVVQMFVARLTIDGTSLVVGGGFYRVVIDRNAIHKEEVRTLPKDALDLGYRANGIGMPGFALGWFESKNGGKVFALVTDKPAVLVPTTLGYNVIVSAVDSERLVSTIQKM